MEKFKRAFSQQKSNEKTETTIVERLSEQKSKKNGNQKNEVIALEEKDSEDSIKSNIPSLPIQPISRQKS